MTDLVVPEELLSLKRDFASPSDPFDLSKSIKEGLLQEETLIRSGCPKELFLVATLTYWLSSFVFPTCQGHELRAETFPMACQLARGTITTIGVSCLSALYGHLDHLSDPQRPAQSKKRDYKCTTCRDGLPLIVM